MKHTITYEAEEKQDETVSAFLMLVLEFASEIGLFGLLGRSQRYVNDNNYSQPGYEEDFVEYDEPTTSTNIPDVNASNAREVALLHLREAAVAFRLLGMDDHAVGLEAYAKELESGWSLA